MILRGSIIWVLMSAAVVSACVSDAADEDNCVADIKRMRVELTTYVEENLPETESSSALRAGVAENQDVSELIDFGEYPQLKDAQAILEFQSSLNRIEQEIAAATRACPAAQTEANFGIIPLQDETK